jgi:membrane protease subunit (stomatin/prohibitin family)
MKIGQFNITIFLSFLITLLLCSSSSNAFQGVSVGMNGMRTVSSTTSLNVFGNKKSKASAAEEAAKKEKFWQGEWVCKDCGYIYNRVSIICL